MNYKVLGKTGLTVSEVGIGGIPIQRADVAAAKALLTENRSLLDEIAEYLLLKETITGEELMRFVNADKNPPAEPAEETTEE